MSDSLAMLLRFGSTIEWSRPGENLISCVVSGWDVGDWRKIEFLGELVWPREERPWVMVRVLGVEVEAASFGTEEGAVG